MCINCDVGEGFEDEKIMPYIQLANIACGGHCGTTQSMTETVRLAQRHQVQIGAHPSYPDKENFGRASLSISLAELEDSLLRQIENLKNISPILHIKPHGKLYHDASCNSAVFKILLRATKGCHLIVPSNLSQALIALAQSHKIPLLFEAFADRAYQENGDLVNRSEAHSIYTDPQKIIEQFKALKTGVVPLAHKTLKLKADTVCLHGDNPASVKAAAYL